MNFSPPAAVRPAEQLLIDLIPELAAGRLLANTAGRAQFAAAYAAAQPTATSVCWFHDLYQCEQSQGVVDAALTNLQLVCTADLPEGDVDLVALALSMKGDGELTRDLLQQAHQRLASGGRFIAAIDHPEDTWLHDQLHKLYDKVTRRPLESGVVYLATKKAPLKKLKNYDCELQLTDNERALKVLTRPSVFSHREIDAGARALITIMEIDPNYRVLDLGCGSGVVGLAAAAREPGVSVQAIDSNPRAVQCAQWAAVQNELPLLTATLDCDGRTVAEAAFDLVLANPPYYSNFRLAEVFVEIAKKALVVDGYLLIVTKTPDWYEEHLPKVGFGEINVLPVKNYTVVTCMKD